MNKLSDKSEKTLRLHQKSHFNEVAGVDSGENTAFELLSNIRLVDVTSGGKRLLGLKFFLFDSVSVNSYLLIFINFPFKETVKYVVENSVFVNIINVPVAETTILVRKTNFLI